MAPRVAVVGAGAAGLAAAERLRRGGCEVVVLERGPAVGGRTRSVLLGPGHRLDTGAAWLTSFYPRALAHSAGLAMLRRDVAGLPDLVVDGQRHRAPFGPGALVGSRLLTTREKLRFAAWVARALLRHPRAEVGGAPTSADAHDADDAVRLAVGPGAAEYVLRPAFETMVFAPLGELSARLVEGWLRAALTARYLVPADGMDAPWRRLALAHEVRCHTEVRAVRSAGGGVEVEPVGTFDAAVVAVPAPVAARLVAPGEPGRPAWLDDVRYASHVFGYAAHRHPAPPGPADVHPAGPGEHRVGSVALHVGGDGRLPVGWGGATVSAEGPWSAELLGSGLSDDDVLHALWQEGLRLEPRLLPLEAAEVTYVSRLPHAVPVFGPGHLGRLAGWQPRAPIALAGDWACYPCVEGAVVAGERAADAVLAGTAA